MAVAELLAWLPASLRLTDDEESWWTKLLGGHARVEDYLVLRRAAVATLLDPARVPDDQVRDLAALVGLDESLAPVRSASVEELRRLIPVAVALWRRKGSIAAARAVVRQLVGRSLLVREWVELRVLDGHVGEVSLLPDPGTAVGSEYDYPERVADLWVADPDVDLEDLAGWLELVRALQRRYNLRRALLVEDCLDGEAGLAARWVVDGAVAADETARTIEVGASSEALALQAITSSSVATLWLGTWTGLVRLVVLGDVDDGYHLEVDWTSGVAQLLRVVGGVGTLLATDTWPVADGTEYRVRLEAVAGALSTTVRARWEGLILEADDSDAARHTAGGIGLLTASASTVSVAGVLAYELPPDTVRVGPSP